MPSIHEDSDATLPYSSSGEKSPLPQPALVSSLPSIHVDSDATLPYSSSDETIPYRDHGEDNASACQLPPNRHDRTENPKTIKDSKNCGKSTKHRFDISLLVSGNATNIITSNVQNQDVAKLSIKCETGTPTTAWFIKTD